MKTTAVTEDEVTISQHFGRAPFYLLVTVENGKIVARERRDKMGHAQSGGAPGAEEAHVDDPRGHGFDAAAQGRHAQMVTSNADCQALLARGMGAGACQSIQQAGVRPIVTDISNIDQAVQAYLDGRLVHHKEQLH